MKVKEEFKKKIEEIKSLIFGTTDDNHFVCPKCGETYIKISITFDKLSIFGEPIQWIKGTCHKCKFEAGSHYIDSFVEYWREFDKIIVFDLDDFFEENKNEKDPFNFLMKFFYKIEKIDAIPEEKKLILQNFKISKKEWEKFVGLFQKKFEDNERTAFSLGLFFMNFGPSTSEFVKEGEALLLKERICDAE